MELFTLEEYVGLKYDEITMIKTGNNCINKTVGGLYSGCVHLITAPSGNGKSLLLLHLAIDIAKCNPNTPVLYISLENDFRIDIDRLKKAIKQYNIKPGEIDNLLFIKDALGDNKGVFKKRNIKLKNSEQVINNFDDLLNNISDCIVFIDGPEYAMDSFKDGADMFEYGKTLLKRFNDNAQNNNNTFIMSWQLTRGTSLKKITEITADDISVSIGISRIATTIWALKKDFKNRTWDMINVKSRQEVLDEIKPYNLLNSVGQFDILNKF